MIEGETEAQGRMSWPFAQDTRPLGWGLSPWMSLLGFCPSPTQATVPLCGLAWSFFLLGSWCPGLGRWWGRHPQVLGEL